MVDTTAITDALLMETNMPGKDPISIQIRAGHKICLASNNQQEWCCQDASMVCGVGLGLFKLLKPEEVVDSMVEFKLSRHDELAVANGSVSTLGEVVGK